MEEEKKKINKSIFKNICLLLIIVVVVIILVFIIKSFSQINDIMKKNKQAENNYISKTIGENVYFVENGDYTGEYVIEGKSLLSEKNEDAIVKKVMSYWEYKDYCKKYDLKCTYNNIFMKYIVYLECFKGATYSDVKLSGVEFDGDTAKLYVYSVPHGDVAGSYLYAIVIPTDKDINNIEIYDLVSKKRINIIEREYERGNIIEY